MVVIPMVFHCLKKLIAIDGVFVACNKRVTKRKIEDQHNGTA